MRLLVTANKIACILIVYWSAYNLYAITNLLAGGGAEDIREVKKWQGPVEQYSGDRKSGNYAFKKSKGNINIYSPLIPIDVKKTYCLSGIFKSLSKKSIISFGLKLFDKDKQPINSMYFNVLNQTEANLAKAAAKGDETLLVSGEAANWSINRFIAFNTKDDYSDLPNQQISPRIRKLEIAASNYEVTLAKPIKSSFPLGTKLRLHSGGNSIPAYISRKTVSPATWTEFSTVISGVAPLLSKKDRLKFLPGTAYAQIYIYSTKPILFDDISLTELTDQTPPLPVDIYCPPVLVLKCEKPSAIYKCNEEAVFNFYIKQKGKLLTKGTATAILSGPDNYSVKKQLDLSAGKIQLKGTLKSPGFLNCLVKTTIDKKRFSSSAAAGFEPQKIQPAQKCPADFMDFWKNSIAEVNKIPADIQLTKLPKYSNPKYESYKISVATLDNTRIYGFLCVPKGKKGPFPAIAHVPGAGPGVDKPLTSYAEKGALSLVVNVFHKELPSWDSGNRKKAYREMNKGGWYFLQGKNDRNTYYYRKPILGIYRLLTYLTNRPDWNKKELVMYGFSQGGGFSLIMSGLFPKVTALVAGMPALCDFGAGSIAGWPKPGSNNKEVRYFDAVNFSSKIHCPAIVTVGFVDKLCTPSSVYAAYNQLKGPKKIFNGPLSGHGSLIPVKGFGQYMHKWIDGQLGFGPKLKPTK